MCQLIAAAAAAVVVATAATSVWHSRTENMSTKMFSRARDLLFAETSSHNSIITERFMSSYVSLFYLRKKNEKETTDDYDGEKTRANSHTPNAKNKQIQMI